MALARMLLNTAVYINKYIYDHIIYILYIIIFIYNINMHIYTLCVPVPGVEVPSVKSYLGLTKTSSEWESESFVKFIQRKCRKRHKSVMWPEA